MKKLWLLLIIVVVVFVGVWFFFIRGTKKPQEQTVDKSIPSAYDSTVPEAELISYKFMFGSNLSLKYPKNWELAEGAENSESAQIVTIESPKDDNGHYYCINFDEYGASNNIDLALTGVRVVKADKFNADGIGKDLQLVVYGADAKFDSNNRAPLRMSLIDMPISVGADSFSGQIVNPAGRRLQVTGRFDCREEAQPNLTLEQFDNAHWQNIASKVLLTLNF